jgi:hypothetical protein
MPVGRTKAVVAIIPAIAGVLFITYTAHPTRSERRRQRAVRSRLGFLKLCGAEHSRAARGENPRRVAR